MARGEPLVPVLLLGAVIVLAIASVVLAARPPVRSRLPWLLPEVSSVVALGLIHLLFFWQPYRSEALVPRGGGDLVSFFYPIHAFAGNEITSGRIPFWNPHLYAGAPHLANFQTAVLYPPNLVAYVLSSPFSYAAMERLALVHYLIASLGVYWLARAIGIGRPGAVLAGGMFASSGFMVAHLGHYSMLATAAWMPWVYAAIVGAVRRQSWPIALLGAVALTLSVLGGHQPILLLGLTFAGVLALFELWRAAGYPWSAGNIHALRDRKILEGVFRLGFMAIVPLLIAAPVLGPAFQMTEFTVRSGLSYRSASEFAVEPVALLHLVLPTVYGSNPTDYWGHFSNTEIWGYTGVLGLGLALFGVLASTGRTRAFWATAGVVAFLFLLGPFASIHGWAYAFVPGYDQIRGAGRGYMFVNLAVALLAGAGLTVLEQHRSLWSPGRVRLLRQAMLALGAALAIVIGVVIPLFAVQVLGTNDPGNRPIIAMNNVMMLAVWLGLGLTVLALIARRKIGRSLIVGAVITVVLLDIFHATSPFNPTTDPILNGFDHPDTVAFLQSQAEAEGPFRIDVMTPRWQPDLARIAGLDDIGGLVDPLALQSYEPFLRDARANRDSDMFRSLNVRYVLSDADTGPPDGPFEQVFESERGIVVWELQGWQPRAWVEGSMDPVSVTAIDSNTLQIDVASASNQDRLVVSQVHYPGWTATVDGESVPVQAYNGVLQAIDLPGGATTVELVFRPERWTFWVALSVAGMLIWIAAAGWTVVRGRRRWNVGGAT